MAITAQLIIPSPKGVFLIYDKSARRFISKRWYDTETINEILGLNKPKNRIKSLTGLTHDDTSKN